jgi:hypothetical protein
LRSYGGRHPSPNAGRCEAAFAGALGVRLGGSNAYDGVTEQRPWLGDGRPPWPADIARAVRLSRAVTVAATGIAALLSLITEDPAYWKTPELPRSWGERVTGDPGLRGEWLESDAAAGV